MVCIFKTNTVYLVSRIFILSEMYLKSKKCKVTKVFKSKICWKLFHIFLIRSMFFLIRSMFSWSTPCFPFWGRFYLENDSDSDSESEWDSERNIFLKTRGRGAEVMMMMMSVKVLRFSSDSTETRTAGLFFSSLLLFMFSSLIYLLIPAEAILVRLMFVGFISVKWCRILANKFIYH